MRIEGLFDLGDAAFPLFAHMMLVVTAAVALAGVLGVGLKRRADLRHALWLDALAVALLSPLLVWMGDALKLTPIVAPRFSSTPKPAETPPVVETASPPPPSLTAVPVKLESEPSPSHIAAVEPVPEIARTEPAKLVKNAAIVASPARPWSQTARAERRGLAAGLAGPPGSPGPGLSPRGSAPERRPADSE